MNDRLETGLASVVSTLQTSDLQDDDTFASAASDKVASSESIKAYVDAQNAAQQLGASIGLVLALGG